MNTHTPPPSNDDMSNDGMPNDDTPNDGTPNDSTLTPEERELAALYQRLPQDEPPPALDAAILAQARRAVQPQRARHRRGRHRWALGIGSAAALVVAAGLGWHVYSLDRGPANVSATTAAADQATPTSTRAADRVAASPQVEQPSAPTQAASEARASRTAVAAAAPPPPPAAVVAKPAPRVVAKSAPRRIAPPPPPALPPPPTIEEIHVVAAPAPAPPAPAPPPPPAPPTVDIQGIAAAPVAAPSPPPPPAQALPAQATPAPKPALRAGVARFTGESAGPASTAAAIQHIRELLKANQRAQALAALRDFTRDHPDYILPDDLKALAESASAGH